MQFRPAEDILYCNALLGKDKLDLLSEMFIKAGLATIYTSHCLRAAFVTILKASGLQNFRVKSMTGRKSDSAVENYHNLPTHEQQDQSSAIISDFVAGCTEYQVSRERALMENQQGRRGSRMSSAGRLVNN